MENKYIETEQDYFKKIIVLDIANNHFGNLSHGKEIINVFSKLKYPKGYKVYFKLQFRNLDTFIHIEAPKDSHYIKRFNSTKLTKNQILELSNSIKEIDNQLFGLMVTPFDEDSVSWAEEAGTDLLKVASCSANDWPLLTRISQSNISVVASTGGLKVSDIDNLVSFLRHKGTNFSLMHCISVYPTKPEDCNISFINELKKRYPDLSIGWSTHEPPENNDIVIAALSVGAELLERHICLPKVDMPQNAYSSDPDQLQSWLNKIELANNLLDSSSILCRKEEKDSIKLLARGAYAKREIKKGEILDTNDFYYAFPILQKGQHTASTIKIGSKVLKNIKKDYALIENDNVESPPINSRFYLKESLHEVKALLSKASIKLNSTFTLELSHHKGRKNFKKIGTTIINCINREYCKKILVQLPNQFHPLHYHPRKEETFQILNGSLDVISDGHKYCLDPGQTLTVLPGVWHSFSSKQGCVFEEVSTTHFNEDSVYKDHSIQKLSRNERKTIVDHWGRFQMD